MSLRLPPALAGPPWFPPSRCQASSRRRGGPGSRRRPGRTRSDQRFLSVGSGRHRRGPGERGGSGTAAARDAELATARPVDSRGGTGCRSAGWAGSVTPGTVTGWLEEEPGPDPACGAGWGSESSMNTMDNMGREGCEGTVGCEGSVSRVGQRAQDSESNTGRVLKEDGMDREGSVSSVGRGGVRLYRGPRWGSMGREGQRVVRWQQRQTRTA